MKTRGGGKTEKLALERKVQEDILRRKTAERVLENMRFLRKSKR